MDKNKKKERYVQTRNPRSGNYVKIDRKRGRIMGSREKPYKGIRVVRKNG